MLATLPDGLTVLLRPIRPGDKAALALGITQLSPDSAYARFLTPKPRLTTKELRFLTEVDGIDHVALVAAPPAHPELLLAVGRFLRDAADPEQAEVAVIVADHLHGRGLGTALGLALADAARERGIRRFTATMSPGNTPALRLLARLTRRLESHVHAGVRELVAELAA
jgi:RimJ/RimL family protein N-acetyltransferase